MRKVIYHVASTVDGFIQEGDHASDYLNAMKNDYDVVFMGRNTYDFGLKFGVTNPYPWMKQYVFSSSLKESPNEHVELISSDPSELVRTLKNQTGKDLYLCGGGDLAGAFLNASLIEEIILKLNPVVFGAGISLFGDTVKTVPLKLEDAKVYSNGVILIRYAVLSNSDS